MNRVMIAALQFSASDFGFSRLLCISSISCNESFATLDLLHSLPSLSSFYSVQSHHNVFLISSTITLPTAYFTKTRTPLVPFLGCGPNMTRANSTADLSV